MKQKIKLGEEIVFSTQFIRSINKDHKEWVIKTIPTQSGIIVGIRTIYDGDVDYDMEEGNSFQRTHHKQCYIVATDLNKNFVKIPIDCLHSLNTIFGCHVDFKRANSKSKEWTIYKNCVIDYNQRDSCTHANRIKYKESCKYWREVGDMNFFEPS